MAFTKRLTALSTERLPPAVASPVEETAPPLLHVLLLERSAADADLILNELRRGGYKPVARRISSHEEMLDAFDDFSCEIVLLDYVLSGGTALDALAELGHADVVLPAILVAGGIGEEKVADALRAGARDYVNKDDLSRLVPAVARELAQVEARRLQLESDEALRLSEKRLRLALRAGGMGTWEWDLPSGRLDWSETLEMMFGLEPGAFGGTYAEFIGLVHPDDRERVGTSVMQALHQDSPAVIYRAVWPNGAVRWHEHKSQRVDSEGGRASLMAGVTFDVTEREEAAQVLRESEERFRLIAEHAHDLIALLDAEGRFCYASPSWESVLGHPPGSLLGRSISEFVDAEDWLGGTKSPAGEVREVRLRKLDGSWLWVEGLSYQTGPRVDYPVAVIARDISERKNADVAKQLLEEELRQSHKVEAIGQLAGGIAHDFNNLLTVISGYTQLLLRRLGADANGSKEITEIGKAADRAARLTRQLLAYSRKQALVPRPLDLNDVVSGTKTMLERVIGENIEFSTTLAEDLGSISADEGQIEQIIINLVVNARDAMGAGGKLRLETRNVALEDVFTRGRRERVAGDYVLLAVTDTGQGMDAATVSRIFDPFYTTKERSEGTGLGLSTVYGIVKQSGGHIEVESEPGSGTTFRLYFPQAAEEGEASSAEPPGEQPLMGSETVLLVEDEPALRELGRVLLETYGYTVLIADNGAEGLEIAKSDPRPIHLLMTDIMMPRMGGIELAERVATLRPELKVLYTSGYNDSGGNLKKLAGAKYLQKPYAVEDLGRTLRDLLDPGSDRRASPSRQEGDELVESGERAQQER